MSSHPCRPHCFCQQLATLIPTADFGLVYECHYTDTTVWNHYPVDSQKLAGSFWSNVAPPTSNCTTREQPQTGQEGSGLSSLHKTAATTATVPPLSPSSTNNTNDQLVATTPPRICGFHFHARDWTTFAERFFQASLKSVQKNVASNVYYSQHYRQVAQDFPEEHYAVVLMARAASCSAQMASVAKWLRWEAALDFPKLFGDAPNCYCNRPMTLCHLRHSALSSPTYFCHQRQKTNIGGCSRFLEQKTRSLRQPLQPCHPLDAGTPHTPKKQQRRAAAHPSQRSSFGFPVNESVIKVSNFATTTSSITNRLDERDGDDGENSGEEEYAISRKTPEQSQPMDPSSEGLSGQGTTEQATEPDASGSDDLQQKLIIGMEMLAQQFQRRAARRVVRKEVIEEYHISKNALEMWTGSVERLKAQIEAQQQLGYNNPDLTCVACCEGPIDYAMIPCFHMAMCSACICEQKECVLCKTAIKSVQRVYWG